MYVAVLEIVLSLPQRVQLNVVGKQLCALFLFLLFASGGRHERGTDSNRSSQIVSQPFSAIKNASTGAPGRSATCHLTDFNETRPV